MLMREKRDAKQIVKRTAESFRSAIHLETERRYESLQFSGISQPSGTFWNHPEKGRPWSRAKAKSCRDAVAMFVMALAVAERTRIHDIAVAAPFDPVAL